MRRRYLIVVVLGLAAALGLGLGLVESRASSKKPRALATAANGRTIAVVFRDGKLTVKVRRVTAGRVTFAVENRGKRPHRLVVLRTSRKASALPVNGSRAQVRGRKGVILVRPGQTRLLTLTLRPGRYALIGNLPGHYASGEFASLRVLPATETAAAPSPTPSSTPSPSPAPAPAPQPQEPPPLSAQARSLFRQNCGVCHTLSDAGSTGTVGPNLDAAQPSFATVVQVVTDGRGAMPSFSGGLTEQQIESLASYVSAASRR